jgi:5-methylcytosine-specific restriction endonuclease McrA
LRHNFSKATKKLAYARAGGLCEGTGSRYGKAAGERCRADLSIVPVEYDHWPLGAHAEGSNALENCVATCRTCNQWAANHTDKRVEAKLKRIQRKHGPKELRKVKAKIAGRAFQKGPKQKIASRGFTKVAQARYIRSSATGDAK